MHLRKRSPSFNGFHWYSVCSKAERDRTKFLGTPVQNRPNAECDGSSGVGRGTRTRFPDHIDRRHSRTEESFLGHEIRKIFVGVIVIKSGIKPRGTRTKRPPSLVFNCVNNFDVTIIPTAVDPQQPYSVRSRILFTKQSGVTLVLLFNIPRVRGV